MHGLEEEESLQGLSMDQHPTYYFSAGQGTLHNLPQCVSGAASEISCWCRMLGTGVGEFR